MEFSDLTSLVCSEYLQIQHFDKPFLSVDEGLSVNGFLPGIWKSTPPLNMALRKHHFYGVMPMYYVLMRLLF